MDIAKGLAILRGCRNCVRCALYSAVKYEYDFAAVEKLVRAAVR